ncbi:MAG: HDIG domain-containing protein [Sandaracinaceae bacterium]|nr:HDIG domain-containing protein [Sandaracinaceae bacterium]
MLRTRIIASTAGVLIVSAVFAALMTLVNRVETFVEPARVEPGTPAPVTLRVAWTRLLAPGPGEPALRGVAPVIARGEVVEGTEASALVTAIEAARRPPQLDDLLSLFFVYFLVTLMLSAYMRGLSPGRGALIRTQLGLLALALVLLVTAKAFLLFTSFPAQIVPVAAMSVWTAQFLDRRTALILGLAMAFYAASLVGFGLATAAVYLATSVASVLWLGPRARGTRVLSTGLVAALVAGGVYAAARVIFDGELDVLAELEDPIHSPLLGSIAGGLASGVVAWALSGVAVVILGSVSRTRLIELSDLDQPLLKKMAREAPGSWEHSRAMANLAEAAANAIGADALLTRVGAYYHDLGKTCQAKYFVENLHPGEPTPHRHIPADLSADAIMAHVVEGVSILRDGRIPEPVIEFAYTHHGTSVIEYFWHKTLEEGNPRQRDESFFRYPGMRPRTKETAIVMLIDAIEAASRTVEPDRHEFEAVVQRIIFGKLRQGQLDECGLTLLELRTISAKVVDSLCGIYHSRIKYPWQETKGDLPQPGAATEADVAKARSSHVPAADESTERPRTPSEPTDPPQPQPEAP